MFNDSKIWYFLPYLIVIGIVVLISFVSGLSNGAHDTSVYYTANEQWVEDHYSTNIVHKVVILQKYMAGNTPVIEYVCLDSGDDSTPKYYSSDNIDKVYSIVRVNQSYDVKICSKAFNYDKDIFHSINGVEI